MSDIRNILLNYDFTGYTAEEFHEYLDHWSQAHTAIISALEVIGNLITDATNEDYSGDDALRDLRLIGNALRVLPHLAAALDDNATRALLVLSHSRGAANDKHSQN